MGFWHGMMKYKNLMMDVTINYEKNPKVYEIKWNGSGISNTTWPLELNKKYDTNIGTIEVDKIDHDAKNNFFYSFKGVNNPTGPLAIEIGKEL